MKSFWSRRDFLFQSGGGMSGLALAYLLNQDGLLAAPADGGVCHLDTFDPKPALEKYAGQPLSGKGEIVVRQGNPGPLMPSPFQFRKHGQCGMDVSEIFPLLAQHVDEMAFLRSVYGKSNDHVQAHYELNTGKIQMGLPCVGSWVTYGLGAESQSLPAFVVIYDHRGGPLVGPPNVRER